MKIKTSELTGAALDWAVAKCEFPTASDADIGVWVQPLPCDDPDDFRFQPSTDWAQGGPVIEREKIEWQWLPSSHKAHQYGARKPSLGGLNRTFCMDGPTILIAAMRCYVASKLGDAIEMPDELTQGEEQ